MVATSSSNWDWPPMKNLPLLLISRHLHSPHERSRNAVLTHRDHNPSSHGGRKFVFRGGQGYGCGAFVFVVLL